MRDSTLSPSIFPAPDSWRPVLSRRLRKARLRAGISQTQLQLNTGLGKSILSHVEHGTRRPSLGAIVGICKGLSVSLDWLLGLPKAQAPEGDLSGFGEMEWTKAIGPRLRFCRERAGTNQSAFSKLIGVSAGMISNLEGGTRNPSVENLIVLCRHFKVPASWLLALPDFPKL